MQVVFPPPKVRRYVGVRLARCTHKESPCSPSPLADVASRSENQRPGGWWYHPARRSRTGTDEMRNHRIR